MDLFKQYAIENPRQWQSWKQKPRDQHCIVCNAINAIYEDREDQGRCRICNHPLPPCRDPREVVIG